jgi:hypothetical protein
MWTLASGPTVDVSLYRTRAHVLRFHVLFLKIKEITAITVTATRKDLTVEILI